MKKLCVLLLALLLMTAFCACKSESADQTDAEEATEAVTMSYVLKPAPQNDEKVDAESLLTAKSILEKRLSGTGKDYSVTLDEKARQLTVTCPGSLLTDLLTRKGVLAIIDPDGVKRLGNADVTSAEVMTKDMDKDEEYYLSMVLTDNGTKTFADLTRASIGKETEVYLDDVMLCSAVVYAPITDGKVELHGGFTQEQAIMNANLINGGDLPYSMEIVSSKEAE